MSSALSRPHLTPETQPLDGKILLFAEDNAPLRKITKIIMEEHGAKVIAVEDGVAAVEEYERNQGAIDLVLMDLKMGAMGGDAAFEHLLQIDPNVKVVLSSGTVPDRGTIERIERQGGGFIAKPYSVVQLCDLLNRVTAGSVSLEKSIR